MAKKIYVGNLPYTINDESLQNMFQEFGSVESAKVITDRDTGRSKGFGFVEMANDEEAVKAINELNEKDFDGRKVKVNEAKPQEKRSGGGFNRGGRSRY
jgi:cold-inducible RNA-binding protein